MLGHYKSKNDSIEDVYIEPMLQMVTYNSNVTTQKKSGTIPYADGTYGTEVQLACAVAWVAMIKYLRPY